MELASDLAPSVSSHASSILAAALQTPTSLGLSPTACASVLPALAITPTPDSPAGPAPVYKYYGLDYDDDSPVSTDADTIDHGLQPLLLPPSPPRGFFKYLLSNVSAVPVVSVILSFASLTKDNNV